MLGSLPGGDFCSPKSDEKNDGRADGGGGGGGGDEAEEAKVPRRTPRSIWVYVSWGVL